MRNYLLHIFYIIIIYVISASTCYSQSRNLIINYSIYDSLSTKLAEDLYKQTVDGKYKMVNFTTNDIVQALIIKREFANICIENDINFQSDSIQKVSHRLEITRFEVNYTLYDESADSLIREYVLDTFISGDDPKYKNYSKFTYTHKDLISRDDISLIHSTSAPFVNGAVPEKKKSFYEKAFEPVILVSAALLSVLILFSVRSN